MAFKDEVNKNLCNAPNLALLEKYTEIKNTADRICKEVRSIILSRSKEHTASGVHFHVDMCIYISPMYAYKTLSRVERKPGWFDPTYLIEVLQLDDALITLQNVVETQLAQDGIHVSKWMTGAFFEDSYYKAFSRSFGYYELFTEDISRRKISNIDPYTKFTVEHYQKIGATAPQYGSYELLQGNVHYTNRDLPGGYTPYFTISYSG